MFYISLITQLNERTRTIILKAGKLKSMFSFNCFFIAL